MTEDMVARVARAVFATLHPFAPAHRMTDFDSPWANQSGDYLGVPVPSLAERSRLVARAAIQAMRAASGPMVTAGADELWPYDATPTEYEGAVTQACDVWDAMIDAALA